ncbi:MAG: hypothetical protein M3N98_08975, partial [Actinomycetota bacterium]|nr:hypothetical protein [Actinomycetota bacterium]
MEGLTKPGVYVLGMHRSGTSVAAGLLDRLGLDPGPRASMLSPDEFNSDGYWEQRPIVEWHDSILARLGGFASAPPPAPIELVAPELAADATAMVDRLYRSTWFMKDPRQCLLLGLWSQLRGSSELAVVVSRDPTQVIRSLQRRNAYSPALAAALWERYSADLLAGLAGRPCLFLRYEQLTAQPGPAVASLVEALDRHGGGSV